VRKTAIGLAILMFTALAGLLLAPQFVDLERYRPQIAERISNWCGRPVTLGGPISLSLLPSPHVSVQDLIVANVLGAQTPEMVRVHRVDAAVSFLPLLAGRIEVTSARLLQPVISLERLPDGRDNWAFNNVGVAPPPPGGSGASGGVPRPLAPRVEGLKVGGLTIKVASLSVEDGTISFRGGDTLKTAEHITLRLTGDAVSAPLHAEGNLTLLGTALSVSADVARVGRAELPLSLTVSSEAAGSAEFTGNLLLDGPQPQAKGKLTLKSANLAAAAALAGIDSLSLFPELAKPGRVTGDLDAAPDVLSLDHVSLEFGDSKGDGAFRVALGAATQISAKLSLNAFDLDQFLSERAALGTIAIGPPRSAARAASSHETFFAPSRETNAPSRSSMLPAATPATSQAAASSRSRSCRVPSSAA